jgi:phosphatidylglycerol---prolipoprotein diacylglyceryl transferase
MALPFPQIDPVALSIPVPWLGALPVRWYALAYITGIALGWAYARRLAARGRPVGPADVDDLVSWAALGVIVGGRLGYVLFYAPAHFAADPASVFYLWQGGMAFHGGLLGVGVAMVVFARVRGLPLLPLADIVACAAPIGLFFGRMANFVNGELYGRATEAPWGMVFPDGGPLPRHPSQLYEAGLEGVVLFAVLWALSRRARPPGLLTGVFLCLYGTARFCIESVREPDVALVLDALTMGQTLSIPMVFLGFYLIARTWRPSP